MCSGRREQRDLDGRDELSAATLTEGGRAFWAEGTAGGKAQVVEGQE